MELNISSAITNPSAVRYGGLIQDSSGNFLRGGFHGSLGATNVTPWKLWASFKVI